MNAATTLSFEGNIMNRTIGTPGAADRPSLAVNLFVLLNRLSVASLNVAWIAVLTAEIALRYFEPYVSPAGRLSSKTMRASLLAKSGQSLWHWVAGLSRGFIRLVFFRPTSARWLTARGRFEKLEEIVEELERRLSLPGQLAQLQVEWKANNEFPLMQILCKYAQRRRFIATSRFAVR
ncbi:hypothetical protein [Nocardia africana]|uniref:Uncharacterized protein n=1 Tax=Nocardia africana TaxID=134964 RepID=A0ABW6NU01_9NOCA